MEIIKFYKVSVEKINHFIITKEKIKEKLTPLFLMEKGKVKSTTFH